MTPRETHCLNESASNEHELTDLNRDFDSFYQWSLPRVYRYALAATGDRAVAEDITSEAFLSIVKDPSISPSPRLVMLARLRQTVHNKAVDWIRHQMVKRKSYASLAIEPNGKYPESDPLIDAEQRQMVFDALSELPEDYRHALQWRYFDDQTVQQVADLGGWSKTTANSLLYRARAALRTQMDDLSEGSVDRISPDAMVEGGHS